MDKFDHLIKSTINEDSWDDWTPSDPYERWDDSTETWSLHVSTSVGTRYNNKINAKTKNTTEALKLYNIFAKSNNWPKLTKKKFRSRDDFGGNFESFTFSNDKITIYISVKGEQYE